MFAGTCVPQHAYGSLRKELVFFDYMGPRDLTQALLKATLTIEPSHQLQNNIIMTLRYSKNKILGTINSTL